MKIKPKYLFILLFFWSCIPEDLDVDNVPVAEDKLVLSTAFIPNQNISLLLTRTFSALTQDLANDNEALANILVSNAEVLVSVRDTSILLTEITNGIYADSTLPIYPEEIYSISIKELSTGLEVKANTEMKKPVNFTTLITELEYTGFDTVPHIYFSFPDFSDEKNWYMINVQTFDFERNLLEEVIDGRVFTYLTDDSEILESNIIEDDFVALINRDFETGDSIVVTLANISEEYYDYLERRNNSFFAVEFISEPYNFPTNTENGYGFFNLFAPDNRLVILGEE
ncbi:MAG: hypothetical protein ACI85I_001531 [Arenicella sp.]|jgi:hypothetical protein